MNFTAPGLTASVLPESFYLIGWLGLAFLGWRWLMSATGAASLNPQG
jgi:hypothetical protein